MKAELINEKKKTPSAFVYCFAAEVLLTAGMLALYPVSKNLFPVENVEITQYFIHGEVIRECKNARPMWLDNTFIVLFLANFFAGAAAWVIIISQKLRDRAGVWKKALMQLVFGAVFLCVGIMLLAAMGKERESYLDRRTEERDPVYYERQNGDRRIVICETSYLLGGWGDVYQIDDDDRMVEIGHFSTDDGYRNCGNYDIEWADDGVTIRYHYGDSGGSVVNELFCEWKDE